MFEEKKINIKAYNVSRFIEKFGDASVQNFCNTILEKFLDDKLIELSQENFNSVKQCAAKIEKDSTYVVNSLIEKFDLIPLVKPEKIKVEITAHKQVIKTRTKTIANNVANW